MTDEASSAGPRRRGRGARRADRTATTQRFLPELDRGIPYLDMLIEEQEEIVHNETVRLLEEVGIEFRDDESIDMWRRAGGDAVTTIQKAGVLLGWARTGAASRRFQHLQGDVADQVLDFRAVVVHVRGDEVGAKRCASGATRWRRTATSHAISAT